MLYDLTVVQFSKMLNNLNHILDKGEAFAALKRVDIAVLLNSRLAADHFNLIRQIQIACDTAKVGVARLTGQLDSAPKHDDSETTLAELRLRIASVLEYLEGFSEISGTFGLNLFASLGVDGAEQPRQILEMVLQRGFIFLIRDGHNCLFR